MGVLGIRGRRRRKSGRFGSSHRGNKEESGVSEVLKDVLEEEKELENDERKDVLEEGVGVDGVEGKVRIDRRRVSLPIRGG